MDFPDLAALNDVGDGVVQQALRVGQYHWRRAGSFKDFRGYRLPASELNPGVPEFIERHFFVQPRHRPPRSREARARRNPEG